MPSIIQSIYLLLNYTYWRPPLGGLIPSLFTLKLKFCICELKIDEVNRSSAKLLIQYRSFLILNSIRFPQMLHYNLHFRFQQILSVLVVPCRLQLLHHHRTSCQPPPETSGGRFLCGIREIHHCQFTFLVQARLEYLRFIVCIFVHALRVFKFLVISF